MGMGELLASRDDDLDEAEAERATGGGGGGGWRESSREEEGATADAGGRTGMHPHLASVVRSGAKEGMPSVESSDGTKAI